MASLIDLDVDVRRDPRSMKAFRGSLASNAREIPCSGLMDRPPVGFHARKLRVFSASARGTILMVGMHGRDPAPNLLPTTASCESSHLHLLVLNMSKCETIDSEGAERNTTVAIAQKIETCDKMECRYCHKVFSKGEHLRVRDAESFNCYRNR